MTSNDLSLEQREEDIRKTAATRFHSSYDAAAEYLRCMDGASLEDQKILFRIVVSSHHGVHPVFKKGLSEHGIERSEWSKISGLVGHMVLSWTSAMIRKNLPLNQTADWLWDKITLSEWSDPKYRVVALATLLNQPILPYAQIPIDFPTVGMSDLYIKEHGSIVDSIALLNRFLTIPGIPSLELALAFVTIFDQITSFDARVVLAAHLLSNRVSPQSQSGFGQIIEMLGSYMTSQPGSEDDEGPSD